MKLYKALLRLYPASFRAEYEDEMRAVFERGRPPGLAAMVTDVVPNALRAHADLLRQDLRYAARALRRAPGFAAVAIGVAALGIGTATAAFSLTDHVLVRPLPYPGSERLVALWESQPHRGISRMELSPGNYRDWVRLASCFEGAGAWTSLFSVNLTGSGEPERLAVVRVTGSLFSTLSARAAMGRIFALEDDLPGAPGTAVLSDRLFRERFGADPAVLESKIVLNGEPYTVIGVMPRAFCFPSRESDLWLTLRLPEAAYEDRTDTFLEAVARLKPGVTVEQARAQMQLVAGEVEREHPKEDSRTGATVIRLRDELSRQSRMLLTVLLCASVGVLLIACVNLANLLVARALARRRELAVRTAMGAGRERLVRQLLTESIVIALGGGSLGILVAVLTLPLAARLVPNALPIAQTPPLDLRMLGLAAILSVSTALFFGVLPALRACRGADSSGLKEDDRAGTGRRTERLRSALVVAEVTMSVALLIASGLLLRALWRVQSVDPGFKAAGVLTLRTELPMPAYGETLKRMRFYETVLTQVRAMPGVVSAAYGSSVPMVWRGGIWPIALEGETLDPSDSRMVSVRYVTPDFFRTLGIPLRAGRDVAEFDKRASPFVAVVSESFARTFLSGLQPIGRRFRVALDDRTVVGVVGDVRVRGFERASEPQVYLPATQVADGNILGYAPRDLVLRSSVAPGTLLPLIRRIVSSADSQQPISSVRLLSEVVEAETAPRSVQARVLGGFAAMALLLAAVGIHGVLSFAVSQRAREFGVRRVLGAPAGEILGMVLRRGLALAVVGAAIGAAIALAAGRAMQALLFGVSPGDPVTFAGSIGLAFAMTLLGSLLPALRAVRVDPAVVLRSE